MKKSWSAILLILAVMVSLMVPVSARTVTTIKAEDPESGRDPYEIFKEALGSSPVDGPSSGHILPAYIEPVGNCFQFLLHDASYEEDFDGSNRDRQRNEIKGYKSSPDEIKALEGDIFTYNWKFWIDPVVDGSPGGFFHIFQIKATDGGEAGAPLLTFTIADDYLRFRHVKIGANMDTTEVLAQYPIDEIKGTWVEATVSTLNKDDGYVTMELYNYETGELLMSYAGERDMWRRPEVKDPVTGVVTETDQPAIETQINRPKWGLYRGIYDEADGFGYTTIYFADFNIIMEDKNFQFKQLDNISKEKPAGAEDEEQETEVSTQPVIKSYGTNLALGRPATQSGIYSDGYDGTKAVDGDRSSRWAGEKNVKNGWLKVDLEQVQSVKTMRVAEFQGMAKQIRIKYCSTDAPESMWRTATGISWSTDGGKTWNRAEDGVIQKSPSTADTDLIIRADKAFPTRYVMLCIDEMDSGNPNINEFEVYGR